MSSTISPHPDGGIDAVVDPDGALRIPAQELARHGVRPGSHLRIITDAPAAPPRRSARGALADAIDPTTVDALLAALDDTKTERIMDIEQRWT